MWCINKVPNKKQNNFGFERKQHCLSSRFIDNNFRLATHRWSYMEIKVHKIYSRLKSFVKCIFMPYILLYERPKLGRQLHRRLKSYRQCSFRKKSLLRSTYNPFTNRWNFKKVNSWHSIILLTNPRSFYYSNILIVKPDTYKN